MGDRYSMRSTSDGWGAGEKEVDITTSLAISDSDAGTIPILIRYHNSPTIQNQDGTRTHDFKHPSVMLQANNATPKRSLLTEGNSYWMICQ